MRHRLRTRPRLAAAAAISLAGGLVAVGTVPAQAECLGYSAWIYRNRQGRDYIHDEKNCILPTQLQPGFEGGKAVETDTTELPPGTPTGAGVILYIPSP